MHPDLLIYFWFLAKIGLFSCFGDPGGYHMVYGVQGPLGIEISFENSQLLLLLLWWLLGVLRGLVASAELA